MTEAAPPHVDARAEPDRPWKRTPNRSSASAGGAGRGRTAKYPPSERRARLDLEEAQVSRRPSSGIGRGAVEERW